MYDKTMIYKERVDPLTLHHLIHCSFGGYMLLLGKSQSITQIIYVPPPPEINVHIKVSYFLFYSKDI